MTRTSTGVLLALDWGKARVGVAACDAGRILAYPVETVPAADRPRAMRRVAELVAEYEPVEVLLGLPISLQGDEGVAARAMHQVASELEPHLGGVPLSLVDERLTSASAHKLLANAGKNSRQRRGMIDQMAAVAILEQALAQGTHDDSGEGAQ